MMRTTLYTALAALQFSGMAFANEQYPVNLPASPIYAGQVLTQTGSEATPEFGRPVAIVTGGGVEMPNSAEAAIESANSLPAGYSDGSPGQAYARSVRDFWQQPRRNTAQRADKARG